MICLSLCDDTQSPSVTSQSQLCLASTRGWAPRASWSRCPSHPLVSSLARPLRYSFDFEALLLLPIVVWAFTWTIRGASCWFAIGGCRGGSRDGSGVLFRIDSAASALLLSSQSRRVYASHGTISLLWSHLSLTLHPSQQWGSVCAWVTAVRCSRSGTRECWYCRRSPAWARWGWCRSESKTPVRRSLLFLQVPQSATTLLSSLRTLNHARWTPPIQVHQ